MRRNQIKMGIRVKGLLAVLGAAAAGALLLGAGAAMAQTQAPVVFEGSVTLDGAPAPAGTVITVMTGTTVCGTTVVVSAGSYANLTVTPLSTDNNPPGATIPANPCALGSSLTFKVNGLVATASGPTTLDYNPPLHVVNLTAVSPTPTPTPSASPTPTATVKAPPSTGSGPAGGSGPWAAVALGVLALATLAGSGSLLVLRKR